MVQPIIRKSHGSGKFNKKDFSHVGENVIIEPGVFVFHPENIVIGDHVYIGHYTILKGYYKGKMVIGSGTWIGQQCFFHSAGDIEIGENVGIGPGVKILTSTHSINEPDKPIIHAQEMLYKKVIIKPDADIGVNAIILPGVTIGRAAQIGAGAVVTKDVPDYEIWAGVPAKFLGSRKQTSL